VVAHYQLPGVIIPFYDPPLVDDFSYPDGALPNPPWHYNTYDNGYGPDNWLVDGGHAKAQTYAPYAAVHEGAGPFLACAAQAKWVAGAALAVGARLQYDTADDGVGAFYGALGYWVGTSGTIYKTWRQVGYSYVLIDNLAHLDVYGVGLYSYGDTVGIRVEGQGRGIVVTALRNGDELGNTRDITLYSDYDVTGNVPSYDSGYGGMLPNPAGPGSETVADDFHVGGPLAPGGAGGVPPQHGAHADLRV
jgi:hypothetical protein